MFIKPFLPYFLALGLNTCLNGVWNYRYIYQRDLMLFKCWSAFCYFLRLLASVFARATNTDVWQAIVARATKSRRNCSKPPYYMASSASGQDEPNRALWLAIRAGKMEPSCPLWTTRCIPQAKFHQEPYNKSFIDQVCSVKMAEYWPRSFFASLLTSTSSRSINTQKKNLANIQPSWPHTWSITHT